jgi:hypothetical protein
MTDTVGCYFKIGDKVEGPIGQRGVVAKIENGSVVVDYHERDRPLRTTYTADWFAKWPDMLKHIGARS